jgi:hypothetical protein
VASAVTTAVPDDDYMTPAEFAALPSDQQHAVWAAHHRGLVDATGKPWQSHRYHREQVLALLRDQFQESPLEGAGHAEIRPLPAA